MPRKKPPTSPRVRIRVGIGGWSYEPWRTTFYPPGTAQARELEYASRRLTSIEVNGTFYRLQSPSTFRKWHDATPEDFVFAVKAPRFIVQRKDLAGAGTAVARFLDSGITELGPKLGPILWQLSPTKRFRAAEIDAFLSLLPPALGRVPLRHALEVRDASFLCGSFLEIARRHGVAVVLVDDPAYPACADVTADFVYARLRRCAASVRTGYSPAALKRWAARTETWARGKHPADLPRISPKTGISPKAGISANARAAAPARDVFLYFINGAKERAPAAAQKLISLLGESA